MAQLSLDTVKVERLVREFLTAQSLTILPQNSFGDAVSQYVDKDDKHAMEAFVNESLSNQVSHLLDVEGYDEDELPNFMDRNRSKLEELFAAGHLKRAKRGKLKPKPAQWDSDLDGEWADQPGAVIVSDKEHEEDEESNVGSVARKPPASRGRGRGGKAAGAVRNGIAAVIKTAAAGRKTAANGGRGKKKVVDDENDDEDEDDGDDADEDIVMIDNDDDEDEAPARTATKSTTKPPVKRAASPVKKAPVKKAPARASTTPRSSATQTKLNFSQRTALTRPSNGRKPAVQELVSFEFFVFQSADFRTIERFLNETDDLQMHGRKLLTSDCNNRATMKFRTTTTLLHQRRPQRGQGGGIDRCLTPCELCNAYLITVCFQNRIAWRCCIWIFPPK